MAREMHFADIYPVMGETQLSLTWITCLTSLEYKYGYSFNNPITPRLNYLSPFSRRNRGAGASSQFKEDHLKFTRQNWRV